MKKYLLIALLPIIFTGSTFGADSTSTTVTENFTTTKIQTEQDIALQTALKDIVEFAQANDAQGKTAINLLKEIKEALNNSKKHPATQSSLSQAYKALTIVANRTMYIASGALLGAGMLCCYIIASANAALESENTR